MQVFLYLLNAVVNIIMGQFIQESLLQGGTNMKKYAEYTNPQTATLVQTSKWHTESTECNAVDVCHMRCDAELRTFSCLSLLGADGHYREESRDYGPAGGADDGVDWPRRRRGGECYEELTCEQTCDPAE